MSRLINLFYLVFVIPVLWALGTNSLPEQYKRYVVFLAMGLAVFHLWRLLCGSRTEGLENTSQTVFGSNIHHVRMFDSLPGYDIPEISIKRGDIVVWTNVGEVEHTVTANNGEFNSGYMKPGDNYSVKFENIGRIGYHCTLHGGWMKGIVTVL